MVITITIAIYSVFVRVFFRLDHIKSYASFSVPCFTSLSTCIKGIAFFPHNNERNDKTKQLNPINNNADSLSFNQVS